MKVTVNAPFRVADAGTIYSPGDTADVPDHVAAEWVAAGWVTTSPDAAPPRRGKR